MNAAKTGLSPTEAEKIKAGLEQCILTLDRSSHALGDAELHLRKQLVQLHAEVEKMYLDSRNPFTPES